MSSPTLSRRALLAGAGTAIATAALVVPYVNAVRADEVCSLALGDAEIRSLFTDWRETYVIANRDCDDAAIDRLWAIEDRLAQIRPTSAEGFAMKLLVLTAYDEFDLDSVRGATLFADAIAITGAPAPWPVAA